MGSDPKKQDPWDEETSDVTDKSWFRPYKPGEVTACLVLLNCPDTPMVGKLFVLEDETTVGRAEEATITINDQGISRQHVRITRKGRAHTIEDLGSTNGTFVNGKRLERPTGLRRGDRIQLASLTVFKFTVQDQLEQEFHQALYDGSYRDPLTGTYNKRYFQERIVAEFSFATRHERPVSLLFLDLDDFKKINDEHGHLAGDAVLRDLTSAVEHALRTEDILARIGGEEFAVVLRDTPAEPALRVAERIRKVVEEGRTRHLDNQLAVTVSIGVSTFDGGAPPSVDVLVETADEQLYRAKSEGKNRVCTAEPAS